VKFNAAVCVREPLSVVLSAIGRRAAKSPRPQAAQAGTPRGDERIAPPPAARA